MPKTLQLQLTRLLDSVVDPATLERSLKVLHLPRALAGTEEGVASRSLIALALNVALFGDLLERVPTGRAYVNDCLAQGREVVFDHGALRTVALAGMGSLPAGGAAITRVLFAFGVTSRDGAS